MLTRERQPTWEEHGVGTLLSRMGCEIDNIGGDLLCEQSF